TEDRAPNVRRMPHGWRDGCARGRAPDHGGTVFAGGHHPTTIRAEGGEQYSITVRQGRTDWFAGFGIPHLCIPRELRLVARGGHHAFPIWTEGRPKHFADMRHGFA